MSDWMPSTLSELANMRPTRKASGPLAAGVEAALTKIAKDIGYIEEFPLRGEPHRDRALEVIKKRAGHLSEEAQKFVMTELEGNWRFWREGMTASCHLRTYRDRRTPGARYVLG